MNSRITQRIVWLNGLESFLLDGDLEREDPRFASISKESARYGQVRPSQQFGRALPLLLAEGWQVESVAGIGNGQSHVLLRRAAAKAATVPGDNSGSADHGNLPARPVEDPKGAS